MKTMMRRSLLLAVFVCALPLHAAQWGVRAGSYTDTGKPFAGVEIVVPLSGPLSFDPSVEYVFQSGYRLLTLNADVTYDIVKGTGPNLWVGAGPTWIRASGGGVSDSKAGLDVLAGVGFHLVGFTPYVQAKEIFSRGSARELVVGAGLRF